MSFGKKQAVSREHRQAVRQPGNFSATIILEDNSRIRCLIKDFSRLGALLAVPTILGIPDQFDLLTIAGSRRRVLVVRRSPSRLGVRFVCAQIYRERFGNHQRSS